MGKRNILMVLLRLLLLVALLIAAALNWYILFLLNKEPIDFALARRYCGIVGGYLIGLAVLLILIFVGLFFTGLGAKLVPKLFSLDGIRSIIIFLMIITVIGLDFALMTKIKPFIENPEDVTSDEIQFMKILAITAAGFGTGIIALYLFYFSIKGLVAIKRNKVDEKGDEKGDDEGSKSSDDDKRGLFKGSKEDIEEDVEAAKKKRNEPKKPLSDETIKAITSASPYTTAKPPAPTSNSYNSNNPFNQTANPFAATKTPPTQSAADKANTSNNIISAGLYKALADSQANEQNKKNV